MPKPIKGQQAQPRKSGLYTLVSQQILQDPSLSYNAKGVLCGLLSCPEEVREKASWLAVNSPDGSGPVAEGLIELDQRGIVRLEPAIGPNGENLGYYLKWAPGVAVMAGTEMVEAA